LQTCDTGKFKKKKEKKLKKNVKKMEKKIFIWESVICPHALWTCGQILATFWEMGLVLKSRERK